MEVAGLGGGQGGDMDDGLEIGLLHGPVKSTGSTHTGQHQYNAFAGVSETVTKIPHYITSCAYSVLLFVAVMMPTTLTMLSTFSCVRKHGHEMPTTLTMPSTFSCVHKHRHEMPTTLTMP